MSETTDPDQGVKIGVWECGCVGFPQVTNGKGESLVLEACDSDWSHEDPVTYVTPFWRDLTEKSFQFSDKPQHVQVFKELLEYFHIGVRAKEIVRMEERMAEWKKRQSEATSR